ncbi:MAG: hypothetical protein JWQ28_1876 [Pedobacter sp.]|jgi:hypothetical protein|nr:hypothetical protein [Pedobacter sp.]
MKNFVGKCCFAAACISIVALGWSAVADVPISGQDTDNPLTVPLVPGYTPEPGVEPGNPLSIPIPPDPPFRDTEWHNTAVPNAEYLNRTDPFNFSFLEEGKTYHQLNTPALNVAFFSGDGDGKAIKARRLKPTTPSPYGWSCPWDNKNQTQSKHPEVLFVSEFREAFMIILSKPCLEFGFELAPNRQNKDFHFSFLVGNFYHDGTRGQYGMLTRTPNGARLYNIQATAPFSVITVGRSNEPGEDLSITHDGVALANIRYKLAE